jgi:lipopolysaccharide export system protein LptC
MTVAPLPRSRTAPVSSGGMRREVPSDIGMARRRWLVTWTKRLLPLGALLLLTSIAMWPEIMRQMEYGRRALQAGLATDFQAGKLTDVRYHGVDVRGRPYTVTADQALQEGPERINLVNPKGDLLNANGSWTLVQSQKGVFIQHLELLDMSGDVTIFRDDGITLRTSTASMDLKEGAAAGNAPTHSEGPFGTLDAQGFALVDKGALIQFQGQSRLLLNGSHK